MKHRKLYFGYLKPEGYTYQLVVNLDMNMISTGYFLVNPLFVDMTMLKSKKQINDLAKKFERLGFTNEKDL